MKIELKKIKWMFVAVLASMLLVQCDDDDSDDMDDMPEPISFDGTFVQEDAMGRPAINTALSPDEAAKTTFNQSAVTNRSQFSTMFTNTVAGLHGAYGVNYETNVLGLDANTLGTVLATTDALQLAPDAESTEYGTALTGRGLPDDVIDVTLILAFGGMNGDRFDGEDDTPELVSDNVDSGDRTYPSSFPYMEGPNN